MQAEPQLPQFGSGQPSGVEVVEPGGGAMPVGLHSGSWDFSILLGAAVFWVLSMFLLNQASSFQKWRTSGQDDAPDPHAGEILAWLVSFSVFGVWSLYLIVVFQIPLEYLIHFTLSNPKTFVPAPIIASIFPAAVSVFKFLIYSSTKIDASGSEVKGPSQLSALIGGLISFLQVCASIATLLMFRTYLFGGH